MVGQELNLLVVDDNKDIRDLLTHILSAHGFSVSQAAEGLSALEMITENIPDLVLLDVMMPGLSGYEVVEKVRSHPEPNICAIPILMITAKSQIEDVENALTTGANDYLIKPFRPGALVEKVIAMLDQPRLSGV